MNKSLKIPSVSIHEDEDPKLVMESQWGKSYFLCKTKPKTPELASKISGKINQTVIEDGKRRRLAWWVVAKPARQVSDRPKERVTITVDSTLLEAVDARAEQEQTYRSTVIERAIRVYVLTQSPEKSSNDR